MAKEEKIFNDRLILSTTTNYPQKDVLLPSTDLQYSIENLCHLR